MQISIIIVSYNVKYFLEQCLRSVKKATKNLDTEIIVVDNNSVDESAKMVIKKFPNIKTSIFLLQKELSTMQIGLKLAEICLKSKVFL